jgi:hypothetical protein
MFMSAFPGRHLQGLSGDKTDPTLSQPFDFKLDEQLPHIIILVGMKTHITADFGIGTPFFGQCSFRSFVITIDTEGLNSGAI